MKSTPFLSPVTSSPNTVQIGTVDPRWLIREYDRQLGIDVSRFLGALDEITVFRCEDTGYEYYRPLSIAGDAAFYRELQKHSWYYMDWKWEHETALRYIKPELHALEIGCGKGAFLQRLGVSTVGLELNVDAAAAARSKGLHVLTETIQAHARRHKAEYDVVCAFQVLEHIAQVNEFITSAVEVLRPGGLLIISVPNNESFIFREFRPILNYPPHHMGLWSLNSLLGLQKIAAIQVLAAFFEPLQPYHLGYGIDFLSQKVADPHRRVMQGVLAKFERLFLHKLPPLRHLAEASAAAMAPYLPGHSVLSAFRKTAQ